MTEIGTLLQDRYLIKEKIGTGGMGAVYLAIDKRFDNRVAIKETFYQADEFGEAFEREARLLNGLQHSVLPHVSDYFAENNSYFLVMQYIEGEDLSDALKREGAFPVEDVLRWTGSLLDALDYLHSQEPPVIHRDIKPHNLKLMPRGDIMLLDFGLAKINQKDVSEVSVFGYSRTYSPLEQIQGTGTDARSDIFALGATAYHLISGKAPVNALTRAAAIVNSEDDPLPPVNEIRPEIPESIASVIHTALALNPQNRFISANAMRQALEHAAGEISNANTAVKTSEAVVGALSPQIVDAERNQNFPALESFAAAKNALDAGQPLAPETLPESVDNGEKLNVADSSSAPIIVDIAPKVSRSRRVKPQKRAIWAVAAVVLLFGIAAAFYFGNYQNSAEQNDQSPAAANKPDTKKSRETTSKTSVSDKTSERTEAEKTEAEKTKVEKPAQSDAKRTKKQSATDDETALEDEKQPLETLETNDPEPQNETRPRPNVREIPETMSDEELKELKREEKEKRRRRTQPTPQPDDQ